MSNTIKLSNHADPHRPPGTPEPELFLKVPKGWRVLLVGERLCEGDHMWFPAYNRWELVMNPGRIPPPGHYIRKRKVSVIDILAAKTVRATLGIIKQPPTPVGVAPENALPQFVEAPCFDLIDGRVPDGYRAVRSGPDSLVQQGDLYWADDRRWRVSNRVGRPVALYTYIRKETPKVKKPLKPRKENKLFLTIPNPPRGYEEARHGAYARTGDLFWSTKRSKWVPSKKAIGHKIPGDAAQYCHKKAKHK